MSDRLSEIFVLQRELGEFCGAFELPSHVALAEMLMAMSCEANEAMSPIVTKTKPWKTGEVDWEHVDEEVIDVFHFVLEYWLLRGKSPEEFFEAYRAKNRHNFTRVQEKMSGKGN